MAVTMQPDLALPRPVAFVRRNWWPAVLTVFLGGLGVYELAQLNPAGFVWLGLLALILLLEWLHTRLGTKLDTATSDDLEAALEPLGGMLVDRETDDVLKVTRRRVLGKQHWFVHRYPDIRRIMEEVEDDFAAGRVSTIPCTVFTYQRRRMSVDDKILPVCVGDSGVPEPYTPPGRTRQWRDTRTRVRLGAFRVDRRTVADLAAQLRRAEPVKDEPEGEHAEA